MRKARWVLLALGLLLLRWMWLAFGYYVWLMFYIFIMSLGIPQDLARAFAAFFTIAVPVIVFVLWIWHNFKPAKKI